jgi:hypothetical protein
VEDAEIAFGTALAGLPVMHVASVVELAAERAGAEEAVFIEGRGAGTCQPGGSRWGAPASIRLPLDVRCVPRPLNDAHMEFPAACILHALKILVDFVWHGAWWSSCFSSKKVLKVMAE